MVLVVLNSNDKAITTQNTNDYTINLKEDIEFSTIRLKYFYIPLSWYNITGDNNSLTIIISSTTYNVNISQGFYSLSELLTTLEDTLNITCPITFNVERNYLTGLITISAASNFEISYTGGLDNYLGYISTQTLTGMSSYVSSNISKIYDPVFIKLTISGVENNVVFNNNNQYGSTFLIELDKNYSELTWGNNITYKSINDNDKEIKYSYKRKLNTFNISLQDSNNNLITNLNSNWYCVFELN